MCSYDYDRPDLYAETDRIARKEHKCTECRRVIQKNEKYRYVFAIYGTDRSIFKTCRHCLPAQCWLLNTCGTYLHGGLEEEILEHAEEYRLFKLYRYLICIRRQWTDRKGNLMRVRD